MAPPPASDLRGKAARGTTIGDSMALTEATLHMVPRLRGGKHFEQQSDPVAILGSEVHSEPVAVLSSASFTADLARPLLGPGTIVDDSGPSSTDVRPSRVRFREPPNVTGLKVRRWGGREPRSSARIA